MAILPMNNKGFLLVDALINCLIVASLSILFGLFKQFDNYYDGYEKYSEELNEKYEILFGRLY